MKIDRLTDNDLAPLADLFRQFWGETSSLEKMRQTFARMTANPAYILLVAKQNNCLAGFAMGVICDELYGDGKPFMVIEDLIVDKNQQRMGIGSLLMQQMEKCATDHDCCQIILVTEANRNQAHRFYQSLGYDCEPHKGFKKRIDTNRDAD